MTFTLTAGWVPWIISSEIWNIAWAGCDTRPVLMLSTVGLNSEFSFPLTGQCTKGKEPSLSYDLSIAGVGKEEMSS